MPRRQPVDAPGPILDRGYLDTTPSRTAEFYALIRRYAYRGQHFLRGLLPVRHRASRLSTARLLPVAIGLIMAAVTGLIGVHVGKRGSRPEQGPVTPTQAVVPLPPGDLTAVPALASYEAEAAVRVGNVRVDPLPGASGGRIVQNIGRDPEGHTGALVFTKVAAPHTGRYTLTIDYVSAERRFASMLVNDSNQATTVDFEGGGSWSAVQHKVLAVDLVAGFNTIAFDNPTDVTPRLDRITIYG